jgi:hypothetical protein
VLVGDNKRSNGPIGRKMAERMEAKQRSRIHPDG